jgi:hypothetical protein
MTVTVSRKLDAHLENGMTELWDVSESRVVHLTVLQV